MRASDRSLDALDLRLRSFPRHPAAPPERARRPRADHARAARRRSRSPPGRCRTRRSATPRRAPVHNLLGFPGAIFADLVMQLLGLAAVAAAAAGSPCWGWRLLSHRPLGEKWRGLLWIARHVARRRLSPRRLPRIGSWPLPTGLGGVVGDAMLRAAGLFVGAPLPALSLLVIAVVLGAARARGHRAVAAGLRRAWPTRKRRCRRRGRRATTKTTSDDRASAWLGMIVHALLSWKARARAPVAAARRARRARVPARRARAHRAALRPARPRRRAEHGAEPTTMTTRTTRTRPQPAPRRRAPRRARRRAAPAAATRCPRSTC